MAAGSPHTLFIKRYFAHVGDLHLPAIGVIVVVQHVFFQCACPHQKFVPVQVRDRLHGQHFFLIVPVVLVGQGYVRPQGILYFLVLVRQRVCACLVFHGVQRVCDFLGAGAQLFHLFRLLKRRIQFLLQACVLLLHVADGLVDIIQVLLQIADLVHDTAHGAGVAVRVDVHAVCACAFDDNAAFAVRQQGKSAKLPDLFLAQDTFVLHGRLE